MRRGIQPGKRRRGLSLLEVLVALGILTAGLLVVLAIFPYTLQAQRDAELLTKAAALAQMKVEEIRRNDSLNGTMISAIRSLAEPSEPVAFQNEPRLAYQFCGRSVIYTATGDGTDPRAQNGVARVIVRYASSFRPSQDVIYELRCN
jgi:type II secretory pathway pseudopilin PulG